MGKVIIGLVLGLVIGAVGALVFGGGAMMGVGAGTGLVTGICSVVEAAQQSGLLTPDQINQVLAKAAENMSGHPIAAGAEIADSGAQCEQVMQDLRAHR